MTSNWTMVKLGKYISQVSIRNQGIGNIEVYSVTNSDGFTKSIDYFNKEVYSANLSNYKVVQRNQFAYNPSRINVGSIAYLSAAEHALISPLYVVFEVDQQKLIPEYLLRYLQSHYGKVQIRNNTHGSVRDSLKYENLERLRIPLPSIADQARIVAILTRVEKLIAKRKDSIKALDELLKSTFLEMFGFNNGDYKQWAVQPLIVNTEIVSGVTKGKKYGSEALREVSYMRVANVQDGHLDLSEIKTIEVTEEEIARYRLRKGDLLLTEGGDPDKLGRGVVWDNEVDECIHQNHIFRVRILDENINPVYLCALISSNYGKRYFLKAAKQTTGIASINSTQLKAFPLILPPPPLQNQFATIVKKVESLKIKYMQSLTELENLYGSLSQRAFKGELDLSKVPIEEPVPHEVAIELNLVKFSMQPVGPIEVTVSKSYSAKLLKSLIEANGDQPFSFDELWADLEKTSLEEMPSYETVKADIYRMLEGLKAGLTQAFDKDRKEMVLRLKK